MEFEKAPRSLQIAVVAITASLYTAFGYMFQPISFLGLQFRVAEIMVGICLIFPYAGLVGNVVGVFLVNLTSPLGMLEWVISPLVNIPALAWIVIFRNIKYLRYLGGVLYSAIISCYVGWILNFMLGLPFWLMFLQVLIAEVILATIGIFLFNRLKKALY